MRDGQTRYRAHSDYTGFTLLLQDDDDHGAGAEDDDGGGGLEIDIDGRWMPVLPRPGSFVVNIGDLFEVRCVGRVGHSIRPGDCANIVDTCCRSAVDEQPLCAEPQSVPRPSRG